MEVDSVSEDASIVHCSKEATVGEVGETKEAEDKVTLLSRLETLPNPTMSDKGPISLKAQNHLSPSMGPDLKGTTSEPNSEGLKRWNRKTRQLTTSSRQLRPPRKKPL